MMLWYSLHTTSALLGTPSVAPAPGRCDAAEMISTPLLEPALALIVITRPGPASHPHSAICSQLWNYKASHKRQPRGDYPDFTIYYCDYDYF